MQSPHPAPVARVRASRAPPPVGDVRLRLRELGERGPAGRGGRRDHAPNAEARPGSPRRHPRFNAATEPYLPRRKSRSEKGEGLRAASSVARPVRQSASSRRIRTFAPRPSASGTVPVSPRVWVIAARPATRSMAAWLRESEAFISTTVQPNSRAIARAAVVLPTPGGPAKTAARETRRSGTRGPRPAPLEELGEDPRVAEDPGEARRPQPLGERTLGRPGRGRRRRHGAGYLRTDKGT